MANKRKRYFSYVKVMLTPEQKELVTQEALRLGLTDSDVVRQLINTLNKEAHKG